MLRTLSPIAQQLRHLRNAPRPLLFRHHEDEDLTTGQHLAEVVASRLGSWGFIAAQAALMASWVIVNTIFLFASVRFDSYPFVFLNLAMSAEAAFTGPILLIAANAGAKRDHAQADRIEALVKQVDTLVMQQRLDKITQITPSKPAPKRTHRKVSQFDPVDPVEE